MSYCRWSSDDFACDVYVYESASGWEIHVAAKRMVPAEPMPPNGGEDDAIPFNVNAYIARHNEVVRIARISEHAPIGLLLDGESYREHSPGDAADRLEEIRAAGYNVPQYAIDELREEEAETHPTTSENSDLRGPE